MLNFVTAALITKGSVLFIVAVADGIDRIVKEREAHRVTPWDRMTFTRMVD